MISLLETLGPVLEVTIKGRDRGWRNGSVGKNVGCSCRALEFSSQHPLQQAQLYVQFQGI